MALVTKQYMFHKYVTAFTRYRMLNYRYDIVIGQKEHLYVCINDFLH